MANNDKVVSVRLPQGMLEQVRAATGMPFSTFCRTIVMHVVAQQKAQLAAAASAAQRTDGDQMIQNAVKEELPQ